MEAKLSQRLRILKLQKEAAMLEAQNVNKISFNFNDIEGSI